MSARAISIWLADDCPKDISKIIQNFPHLEEFGVAVAHVPQAVLDCAHDAMATRLSPSPPNASPDPRTRWYSDSGSGLFGANATDFYRHPDEDGPIMVCRNV